MQSDYLARLQGQMLAARLLRDGVTVRIQVRGTSMWPLLSSSDEVELTPMEGPARPGDIVLTDLQGQGQRLHRVVRPRPGGGIQTRGDACLRLDPAAPAEAVLGRVRRVRGIAGRWRPCAPRPLSRLLACLLLIVSGVAMALGLAPEAHRRIGETALEYGQGRRRAS